MWNPKPSASPRRVLQSLGTGQASGLRSPHILASPPGTPAPIHAINYTPKTGEVHQPGVLAPVDQLNYSLLPAEGGARGMGTGADDTRIGGAPPLAPGQERMVGRYNSPASMASGTYQPGSPPSRPGPYNTGPGPRLAPSGPRPAGFGTRANMTGLGRSWGMGMGADGDTSGGMSDQDATDLANALGLNTTATDSAGGDGGSQPQGQAPAGSASGSDNLPPPPTGWQHVTDPPGDIGSIVWQVSPDGSVRIPVGMVSGVDPITKAPHVSSLSAADQAMIMGKSGTGKAPAVQTRVFRNDDGTNHIWSLNPDGTKKEDLGPSGTQPATKAPPKPPGQAGNLKRIPGTDIVIKQNADGTWTQDQAASDAAAKATADKQAASGTVQAEVIRAAQAQATDKPFTIVQGSDGAQYAVNTHDPTGDQGVVKVTPADPTKNIMTAGNSLLKIAPDGTSADVLYTAPKGWGVTTVGGRTIAYNQDDPTKTSVIAEDPTFAPQAAATLEGTKASTLSTLNAIQSGQMTTEQARETLLQNVHDLLHPKVTSTGGGLLVPSGANVDVTYQHPGTQQEATSHYSGGPIDPEAQAIAKQVNDFLGDYDKRQAQVNQVFGQQISNLGGQPQQQPAPPVQQQQAPATQQATPAQDLQATAAASPAGAVMKPGWPGQDPVHVNPVPPHSTTTAAGDIAHYDENNNLTGITYLNTAPPGYDEAFGDQGGGDQGGGDSLNVGLDQSADSGDGTDMGGGQESFMGRGLTSGRGRGSTGAGWNPRARKGWKPRGAGAGGEAGMGAGGVYVRSPDGSMHWDETKADPNPNGGSVIDSGSGKVIPGANRQSGSTGPGGTGAPGSQARQAHIDELAANPTFRSGTSGILDMMSGASPAQLAGMSYDQATSGGVGSMLSGSVNSPIANPQTNPLIPVAHQVDPFYTAPLLNPSPMHVTPMSSVTQPGQRPGMAMGLGGGHEAYGAGQGTTPGGMPMGTQSPDYQRGYQDGMAASRSPGTPPLFSPGNQQPVPTMADQGQGPPGGGPPGMGGGQDMGAGGPLEDLLGETSPMNMGKFTQTPMAIRKALSRYGGWNDPSNNPPGGLLGQPTMDEFDLQPGAPGTGHEAMGAGADPLYHYALSRRGSGSRLGMGSGQGPSPQPPMGPPGGGPTPPGGPGGAAGWMPPLAPDAVAGIGHRFGQPMDQGEPSHSGVDLQALEGTPTVSPVDGTVERVEHNPDGLGLTVIVRGKDGSEHRLGHLARTRAYPGMVVAQGQDLASQVGSTGNTTGSHLHWGVRDPSGQPQDPTGSLPPGMQQMPPVPGTEMMGPPGGVGGEAQQGAGQESADTRWDLYEAKDTTGFMGPGAGAEDDTQWSQVIRLEYPQDEGALASQAGGYAPGDEEYYGWHPLNRMRRMGLGDITPGAMGTGGEGGMGAGDVNVEDANTRATLEEQLQVAQMQNAEAQHAADQQYAVGMAQVQANLQSENDRHAEALSQLQQQAAFHQDDVALKQMEDAETQRHNQAQETLQAQATQMQQTLEQMKEAADLKLEQVKEGHDVYMMQGDQAFKDWQTTQGDRMAILSSALNNPWLQKLTGMTPAPGQAGTATGGQNLANLVQQVLQPYNYQAWGGQGAQGQNAPAPQQAPAMYQGGGAPGIQTPTWSQWQGWNPFQMAAYRTNIEAMGPGVWNDVQGQMQSDFMAQGGNPNVTQMQAAAATPEQQAGQAMTAELFGQTTPEWQSSQQKQWSQAQAPQVKTNLAGIAA